MRSGMRTRLRLARTSSNGTVSYARLPSMSTPYTEPPSRSTRSWKSLAITAQFSVEPSVRKACWAGCSTRFAQSSDSSRCASTPNRILGSVSSSTMGRMLFRVVGVSFFCSGVTTLPHSSLGTPSVISLFTAFSITRAVSAARVSNSSSV